MDRFDWYSATLLNDLKPIDLATSLLEAMEGGYTVELGRGRGGYTQSLKVLTADGDTLATVLAGGNGNPHCIGTGENAPQVAARLRKAFPHRVSRMDSCIDLKGSYGAILADLEAFQREWGLTAHEHRALRPGDGSTFYLGAPASPIRVRVYQKGLEMLAKGLLVDPADYDLLRFEIQLRPLREGRLTAATLAPPEAWGASPWTRDFARRFLSHEARPVVLQQRVKADLERRIGAMTAQYERTFLELLHLHGSAEAAGVEIYRRLLPPVEETRH